MTTILEGSSKIFVAEQNRVLMRFKDDIHGAMRVGQIAGTGEMRKIFTYYFYRYLQIHGINTHLDDSHGPALFAKGIFVNFYQPVKMEIIVRNVARGHWCDPHKFPIFAGGEIFKEPIVEFCLKWKYQREDGSIVDDPRITIELANELHEKAKDLSFRGQMLINLAEGESLRQLALKINQLYRDLLIEQDWILEDFKFEVGVDKSRNFIVIDEISPDCSRIRTKAGDSLTKDLFRQRKPESAIYLSYQRLAEAVKSKITPSNFDE